MKNKSTADPDTDPEGKPKDAPDNEQQADSPTMARLRKLMREENAHREQRL